MRKKTILIIIFIASLAPVACQQTTYTRKITESPTQHNDPLAFLPEGTKIDYQAQYMTRVVLPRKMEIQGVYCCGGGDCTTSFYPNGQLYSTVPVKNVDIEGVPCSRHTWVRGILFRVLVNDPEIEFHENGQLKACTLADDIQLDGKSLSKWDRIYLDREGKLIRVKAPEKSFGLSGGPLPPSPPIRAGDDMPKALKAFIEEADTDKDGKVSKDEFGGPDFMFESMDKNANGFIEPSEAPTAESMHENN